MFNKPVWKDIEIGTEIAPLVKKPTTQQLVRWAGASGDFYEVHYDKDFAKQSGLANVIVHGALKSAWLGQLLSDWVGEYGTIKKYSCSYRGMDVPGDVLTCKGKVVKKYVNDGEHCVEFEIWLENSRGSVTTSGTALIVLYQKTTR